MAVVTELGWFHCNPHAGEISTFSMNRIIRCAWRKEGRKIEDTCRTVSCSQMDHKMMNCFYLFPGKKKKDDDFLFWNLKENISIPALSSFCYSCLTFVLHASLQTLVQELLSQWAGIVQQTQTERHPAPGNLVDLFHMIWRIHCKRGNTRTLRTNPIFCITKQSQ